MGPWSVEMQRVLAVLLVQLVFRQLEILQPLQEFGGKDLPPSIKAVAREPDHLLLGETDRARVVELVAQLLFLDLLGDADAACPIDHRECHLGLRMQPPDHLQHQQLVEVGVEQAADDRIELPGVVVDPLGDVGCRRHARGLFRGICQEGGPIVIG